MAGPLMAHRSRGSNCSTPGARPSPAQAPETWQGRAPSGCERRRRSHGPATPGNIKGRGRMRSGFFRQSLRIGALVLGCVIALFNQAATAHELTDAIIRYAMHDYERAIEMLTPLADRGNAVAQMQLGLIHARGEGVPRDG